MVNYEGSPNENCLLEATHTLETFIFSTHALQAAQQPVFPRHCMGEALPHPALPPELSSCLQKGALSNGPRMRQMTASAGCGMLLKCRRALLAGAPNNGIANTLFCRVRLWLGLLRVLVRNHSFCPSPRRSAQALC